MKTPIAKTRCAVHYTEKERVVTDVKSWFIITISKIHGRRHLYTDLQEYIRTHSKPGIIVPDIRVVTQDVAQQIAHFMIRNHTLGLIVYYDRPDDVSEVLRYFVPLILPETVTTDTVANTHTKRVVESLANAGFLTNERAHQYIMN
jgi:hypothetical protein